MKKLLSLCCLMLCVGLNSQAQIIHRDINPDSTFGGGAGLAYYVLQPPGLPQFHIFWNIGNMVYLEVHGTAGNGEVLMQDGYPAKLQTANNIAPAGTWLEAAGPTGFLSASINGNWRSDATDKYIGFRFKASAGSGWHYGWLKMTVANAGASFTVKEWAYQATAGVAIKAGEMPSTGIGPDINDPGIGLEVYGRTIYFLHRNDRRSHQYLITDAQGRNIKQGRILSQESIDVQHLAPGVYMIRFYGSGYNSRFKIALP